jgi:hypothetical protein
MRIGKKHPRKASTHALFDSDRRRPADHDGTTRPLEALFYYFRMEYQVAQYINYLMRMAAPFLPSTSA